MSIMNVKANRLVKFMPLSIRAARVPSNLRKGLQKSCFTRQVTDRKKRIGLGEIMECGIRAGHMAMSTVLREF
jgi:hypothetical protein